MRTPRASPHRWPPRATTTNLSPGSEQEAWCVIEYIRPDFERVAETYDTSKYWPAVYSRAITDFSHPESVSGNAIRDALLWKWGHLGKSRIPNAHDDLIALTTAKWPAIVSTPLSNPSNTFRRVRTAIGRRHSFITAAFLTHLLHPEDLPIIDQHNFRALNALLGMTRHDWLVKKRPSQYEDIELLRTFMATVLRTWASRSPRSAPTHAKLDQFLMMYGKSLKPTALSKRGSRPDS